jgi:hypothetical protein
MLAGTHYGDFTSRKKAIECAPVTVRWDGKNGASNKTTFDLAPIYRDRERTLEDLVQDYEPATFGWIKKQRSGPNPCPSSRSYPNPGFPLLI